MEDSDNSNIGGQSVCAFSKRSDYVSMGGEQRSTCGELPCKDSGTTSRARVQMGIKRRHQRALDPRNIETIIDEVWSNTKEETEAMIRCDQELSEFIYDRNFDTYLSKAYGNIKARYRTKKWVEILAIIPSSPALSQLSPADSAHVICFIFKYNHFTMDVLDDIYGIMEKTIPKINCLWLYGPPNSGKSLIATSLAASYRFYSTCNKFDQTSDFGFAQMYNQCCLLVDECSVNSHNFEILKMIAGGADVSVNVKNKDHTVIAHTPMILCTNHNVTHFCSNPQAALQQLSTRVKKYCFHTCPSLKHITCNRLHPKAWYYIIGQLLDVDFEQPILDVYQKDDIFETFNILNYF